MQLVTLTLLALTGLNSVTASSHHKHHRDLSAIHPHYSHPRPRFVQVGGGARALPRAGRRIKRDSSGAQATVKCLTAYTFALCDESDCTDMGSVAAGTMCKDGAITWDTADEASTDDSSSSSSAQQSEVESFASTASAPVAEAAVSPSPSSSSSSIVLHNAAVNTATKSSSSSSAYVAPTSAPAAEETSSWEDDEGDCEEEETDSDDGWTSTSSQAPVANYATSSSSSSTSAYVAPTTTSEYQAPSTTQAAATTSSDSGSGASSEVFTGGRGTFYYQGGAYGACGVIHADSDPIVALAIERYGTGSNNAPDCGRTVVVTNIANGKSVTATVADACPGCANYNSLDLSTGAFDQIADQATGVIDISWYFSS